MPVGPSHGAHSGGSHSSGSFGGGHTSGGYHRESNNGSFIGGLIGGMIGGAISESRRRRFYSRYGYYPEDREYNSMPTRKKPTVFLVFSIVFAFIAIICFSLISGANSKIKEYNGYMTIMETDYDEYKEIVQKARASETNYGIISNAYVGVFTYETYDADPEIPGRYLDFEMNGNQYYFVVYRFTIGDSTYTDLTYTQFSHAELPNGDFEIAYHKVNDGYITINTSYIDKFENVKKVPQYQYYENYVKTQKSDKTAYTITLVVFIALIALFVLLYIKKLKKYNALIEQDDAAIAAKRQAEVDKAQAEAQTAQSVAAAKNRFCQYCGSKLSETDTKCPGCGANLTK